jgi:hypothetical protein
VSSSAPSPALNDLEFRDKIFDLAMAVVEQERAERDHSESADYWRVRMRTLAKQMVARIAHDAVSAPR